MFSGFIKKFYRFSIKNKRDIQTELKHKQLLSKACSVIDNNKNELIEKEIDFLIETESYILLKYILEETKNKKIFEYVSLKTTKNSFKEITNKLSSSFIIENERLFFENSFLWFLELDHIKIEEISSNVSVGENNIKKFERYILILKTNISILNKDKENIPLLKICFIFKLKDKKIEKTVFVNDIISPKQFLKQENMFKFFDYGKYSLMTIRLFVSSNLFFYKNIQPIDKYCFFNKKEDVLFHISLKNDCFFENELICLNCSILNISENEIKEIDVSCLTKNGTAVFLSFFNNPSFVSKHGEVNFDSYLIVKEMSSVFSVDFVFSWKKKNIQCKKSINHIFKKQESAVVSKTKINKIFSVQNRHNSSIFIKKIVIKRKKSFFEKNIQTYLEQNNTFFIFLEEKKVTLIKEKNIFINLLSFFLKEDELAILYTVDNNLCVWISELEDEKLFKKNILKKLLLQKIENTFEIKKLALSSLEQKHYIEVDYSAEPFSQKKGQRILLFVIKNISCYPINVSFICSSITEKDMVNSFENKMKKFSIFTETKPGVYSAGKWKIYYQIIFPFPTVYNKKEYSFELEEAFFWV